MKGPHLLNVKQIMRDDFTKVGVTCHTENQFNSHLYCVSHCHLDFFSQSHQFLMYRSNIILTRAFQISNYFKLICQSSHCGCSSTFPPHFVLCPPHSPIHHYAGGHFEIVRSCFTSIILQSQANRLFFLK